MNTPRLFTVLIVSGMLMGISGCKFDSPYLTPGEAWSRFIGSNSSKPVPPDTALDFSGLTQSKPPKSLPIPVAQDSTPVDSNTRSTQASASDSSTKKQIAVTKSVSTSSSSAPRVQKEDTNVCDVWRHPGVRPFKKTRAEAMMAIPAFERMLGWSPEVQDSFAIAIRDSGQVRRLTADDTVGGMLSGPEGELMGSDSACPHVSIHFAWIPELNMELAAPTEVWTVVVDNVKYEVLRPWKCNNLSWRVTVLPPPPVEVCADAHFTVPIGAEVRMADFATEKHPPSKCSRLEQGGVPEQMPSPCGGCDWRGIYDLKIVPRGMQAPYSTRYIATDTDQVIGFDVSVVHDTGVAICVGKHLVFAKIRYVRRGEWPGDKTHGYRIDLGPSVFPSRK